MVSFMSTIDAGIVNIAVPQISRDLNVPMNEAEWVVSVYLVLICVLLIFFGKLSDRLAEFHCFRLAPSFSFWGHSGVGSATPCRC